MIHAKYKQESTRPRQKLKPARIRIAMNIGRSLTNKKVRRRAYQDKQYKEQPL